MTRTRQRTLDPNDLGALCRYLARTLNASSVLIPRIELLSGGAVQENWSLDVEVVEGPKAGLHRWVLRTDAAARLPVSLDRPGEFAVIRAVEQAGVRVAEPILECEEARIIGAPFVIQAFVGGSAQARKIVRSDTLPQFGDGLARALAGELAKIHSIRPGLEWSEALSFLPQPLLPPARSEVARLRNMLDGAGEARPALEYCLTWLDAHAPQCVSQTLVHGDFRTGNYLVANGTLSAILDWEFAHWGDPMEDIGWFCARCWRFGNDANEAGGIAPRDVFLDAYEAARGLTIDRAAVAYWEILAAAKWAAIAVLQGDRFRSAGEDAIELVLTGLMPPEMELDALLEIEAYEKALAQ